MPSQQIDLAEVKGHSAPAISLSIGTTPLVVPNPNSKRIVVLGGGVSGLMTAWILLDKGYKVTVLSKEWAWNKDWQKSRLTSQTAGALWEFPPGGCGLTEIAKPEAGFAGIKQYQEWAVQSYEFYTKLHGLDKGRYRGEFGVSVTKLNQFFYNPLRKDDGFNKEDMSKLKQIEVEDRITGLGTLEGDTLTKKLKEMNMGPEFQKKLKYAYYHDAPIINTDKAMMFLMAIVENKGADFETVTIAPGLANTEAQIKQLLGAGIKFDGIVNATGLGAKDLCDQDVYPVRGGVKRIDNNDDFEFEHVNEAYLVPAQIDPVTHEHTKVVFLVPRNDETLIVGSIIQEHNDILELTPESPEVTTMWKRARRFLPQLNDAEPKAEYPFAQGLRPFTKNNVKVRAEEKVTGGAKIVHNYGHGGSGWTLAVGCARTAVYLLEEMLKKKDPKNAHDANVEIYGSYP